VFGGKHISSENGKRRKKDGWQHTDDGANPSKVKEVFGFLKERSDGEEEEYSADGNEGAGKGEEEPVMRGQDAISD